MNSNPQKLAALTRRHFLPNASLGVGAAAFSNHRTSPGEAASARPAPNFPHFPPRAKRVIYLFQSGGPSHLDLYDYKPTLTQQAGQDLPASVRQGQRLTGFTNKQETLPVTPSK
jgi:hypothetical protein